MKNIFIIFVLIASIIMLTGCAIFTSKGKAARAEEKSRAKIVNVENQQAINNRDKIEAIAGLAYGTEYALSKLPEPPLEVTVARDINQRVVSIAGSPTIEKIKEMQDTIDKLTSTLATERDEGKKKLSAKDDEISVLQAEGKLIAAAKETELRKYMMAAQEAAASADAYKGELNKMDRWLGMGAIFYGVKKFIISSLWILGIGGLLFLILRIASGANPVASAIFGLFEQIVSWFVNAIKFLFPRALELAGHVSKEIYSASQSLLRKIVDNIQNLKELEKKTGHDITLREILVELDKSMDSKEKEMVSDIKRKLGYQ